MTLLAPQKSMRGSETSHTKTRNESASPMALKNKDDHDEFTTFRFLLMRKVTREVVISLKQTHGLSAASGDGSSPKLLSVNTATKNCVPPGFVSIHDMKLNKGIANSQRKYNYKFKQSSIPTSFSHLR